MGDHWIRSYHAHRTWQRVVSVVAVLVAGAAAALAQQSAPVPNAADQARARELFQDVYGKEYDAARSSAQKTELAKKLLDQAAESKADLASHFVLLRIAKDVAVLAGDAETALEAVSRVVGTYDVDPLKTKLDCLRAVGRVAKSSSQQAAIARTAFSLVDVAMAGDDFESASKLSEIARESARRARDYPLVKQIAARLAVVKQAEEEYAEYRRTAVALEDSPTDPQANLTAGRYLCLVKGDWDRGVPMLALGGDPALKALAVKELEGPVSPEDRIALADGWWEHAAGCEGLEEEACLSHAGKLYEKALPSLSSTLLRTKLTKRLDEITAMRSSDGPIRGREKSAPLPESPVLGVDPKHEVTQIHTLAHVLQVWMILSEYSQPSRYRMSIKHALAGEEGAFYMTVWTDLNGDGVPDTEIARSAKMIAAADGQWSTWEFVSKANRIYVGNFAENKNTKLYYAKSTPAGYHGLSTTVCFSRSHRKPPNGKAKPRCTNIRVQRIK